MMAPIVELELTREQLEELVNAPKHEYYFYSKSSREFVTVGTVFPLVSEKQSYPHVNDPPPEDSPLQRCRDNEDLIEVGEFPIINGDIPKVISRLEEHGVRAMRSDTGNPWSETTFHQES